jgi:hypothetical protein
MWHITLWHVKLWHITMWHPQCDTISAMWHPQCDKSNCDIHKHCCCKYIVMSNSMTTTMSILVVCGLRLLVLGTRMEFDRHTHTHRITYGALKSKVPRGVTVKNDEQKSDNNDLRALVGSVQKNSGQSFGCQVNSPKVSIWDFCVFAFLESLSDMFRP